MDKILAFFLLAGIGLGALLIPRIARGATVRSDDVSTDELQEIDLSTLPTPRGASPLGLRNNNPFNLEFRNIGWRGEIGTDGRFSIFDTAQNGIRAGMINIHTKMTRDGLNNVRKLITRLSPSFENPTESFINFVAGRLSVSPDQPIRFESTIIQLSKAIIQFENASQPFSDAELQDALRETGRV